jgi:hypothetical protein
MAATIAFVPFYVPYQKLESESLVERSGFVSPKQQAVALRLGGDLSHLSDSLLPKSSGTYPQPRINPFATRLTHAQTLIFQESFRSESGHRTVFRISFQTKQGKPHRSRVMQRI